MSVPERRLNRSQPASAPRKRRARRALRLVNAAEAAWLGRLCDADGCGRRYHRGNRLRLWLDDDTCTVLKLCTRCFKGRDVATVLRIASSSVTMAPAAAPARKPSASAPARSTSRASNSVKLASS